eukprot:5126749-Prymnesium_polylepis.1
MVAHACTHDGHLLLVKDMGDVLCKGRQLVGEAREDGHHHILIEEIPGRLDQVHQCFLRAGMRPASGSGLSVIATPLGADGAAIRLQMSHLQHVNGASH